MIHHPRSIHTPSISQHPANRFALLALLHAPLLLLRVFGPAELRPQLGQVVRQAAGLVAADACGMSRGWEVHNVERMGSQR